MKAFVVYALVLCVSFGLPARSRAQTDVEATANLLITLCVAGGKITLTKTSTANYEIGGGTESVTIERSEAAGLVEGINSQISELAAAQANEARDCMKPYLGRLVSLTLGDVEPDDPYLSVDVVSRAVKYNRQNKGSNFDFVADIFFVYKNKSTYLDVKCRAVFRGIRRNRETKTVEEIHDMSIVDFSLPPGGSQDVDVNVGINGFTDSDLMVAYDHNYDCW